MSTISVVSEICYAFVCHIYLGYGHANIWNIKNLRKFELFIRNQNQF